MIEFSMKKARTANYTPADLMHEIAEAGRWQFLNTGYGATLIIAGITFAYDHWKINDNHDGTETVTVYITEVN